MCTQKVAQNKKTNCNTIAYFKNMPSLSAPSDSTQQFTAEEIKALKELLSKEQKIDSTRNTP